VYEFGNEERQAADRVLAGGNLFRYMPDAHEVDGFETEFAAKFGVSTALATSSGTGALICGLSALGIGTGDEVLIPAYGYIADVTAVLAVGAVPVVCEIDESLSLDPADIERKLTPATRAVMPVHMCGFASDMDPIVATARQHGLFVIEDACQAIGGSYRGARLGTIGDVGAFSFNQAKIVTAGEGGCLVTDDAELNERAFITHDASAVYDGRPFSRPAYAGLAFRMNEVSAAILRVQLTRLDHIIARLRMTRDRLAASFEPVAGLRPAPRRDAGGDCGTNLAYLLDDVESAQRFQDMVNRVGGGLWAFQGIALGHSFFEWDMLHERRGAHHPGRDPLAGAVTVQRADDLPRSHDILSRAVLVGYPMDVDDAVLRRIEREVSALA
jgi:dTDP-4-amino-4,6-dideoxygalactose transaminase